MTIVLVSWSKHNILDFGYLLLLCSYFKSTTKHLVSAKIMLLVSEGVVISPPLSSLTLYGGDITPFLEHYGEGGGFPPRGWYPPLVLIWPWATGALTHGLFNLGFWTCSTGCFKLNYKGGGVGPLCIRIGHRSSNSTFGANKWNSSCRRLGSWYVKENRVEREGDGGWGMGR